MNNPLVSIVICEYNTDLEMLDQCLGSIFKQTYKNFEIVFVNDCSNTNFSSLDYFSSQAIRVINNKTNLGIAKSRNIGIKNSNGKYIAFMDTDDVSEPERIEKQVMFLEDNYNVVACGTWFRQFGKKDNSIKRIIDDNEYYRCCLLFGNVPTILNPSVMIRKSAMIENNISYDDRLKYGEDYDMWIKLSDIGIVTNLKEILMNYRIRDGQLSDRKDRNYLNDDLWLIFAKQLTSVGIDTNKYDESFLRTSFKSKTIDALKYFKFLKEISNCNSLSKRYIQDVLDYRIKEQWKTKIYSIKNPFKLLKLFFTLPFKDKFSMIGIELSRLNRKKLNQRETSDIIEYKYVKEQK